MSDTDNWFVLEEEDEKSFSTVHQSDVIYDETVKVDDSVSFFYNKKEFVGKVCMISDDHQQCVREARRLNDLRKKESREANGRGSFYPEPKKERKAAAKAKSTLANIKTKLLKPSQAGKKARSKKMTKDKERIELKKKMEKLANKRLLEKEDDDDVLDTMEIKRTKMLSVHLHEESVDDNEEVEERDFNSSESSNYSSGSSTDDSDEEIEKKKLMRQLSAKLDIKMLRKLANKDATGATSSKTSSPLPQLLNSLSHGLDDAEDSFGNGSHDSSNSPRSNSQEVKCNEPENLSNVNDGPNNLPEAPIVDQQPINAPHRDMPINVPSVNPPINDNHHEQNAGNSQIQIYVVTNPARGVCISEDQIYCTKQAYTKAEGSNCATKALRAMLEGVFTKDTILRCSASGLPPRGKGRQAYTQDPSMILNALPSEGVDAIINKVLALQKEKHMRPKKVESELRSTLSTRLCEIRKRVRQLSQQQQNQGQ